MIDQFVHLLGYDFVQNALMAGFVIAIVSGLVSRFVVARNMAFAVHALAELGFTGSAGAILIGVSPLAGLLVGTTATALFIGALGVRVRERDAVVGIVMAFGLGLGVLFLTLYQSYGTQAYAILFGTITGVSFGDVELLVALGAVTLAALAFVYRPLTFATVDPDVAEARGVPVRTLGIVFLLIMAVAVAEAVQVVGVLLILTLLIAPGSYSRKADGAAWVGRGCERRSSAPIGLGWYLARPAHEPAGQRLCDLVELRALSCRQVRIRAARRARRTPTGAGSGELIDPTADYVPTGAT